MNMAKLQVGQRVRFRARADRLAAGYLVEQKCDGQIAIVASIGQGCWLTGYVSVDFPDSVIFPSMVTVEETCLQPIYGHVSNGRTPKHINKWLNGAKAVEVNQEVINGLV
jgi:hypothetical protein